MAVGDIITAMSGANAAVNYQPAAGVEAVIKSCAIDNSTGIQPALYDGTNEAYHRQQLSTLHQIINSNIGLVNARYLRLDAQGAGLYSAYSGVQVK